MRRKLLIASLVSLGMIAGLTACSGGDEGQATEEVTIATVETPPVDQSADAGNQNADQQPADATSASQAMDQQATTNDSGAMQQQAPAQDETVTTSTTITETTTTTTPADAGQTAPDANGSTTNGGAGSNGTDSTQSNGSMTNGDAGSNGTDSTTSNTQQTAPSDTTTTSQNTSALSGATKLAEHHTGDHDMNSDSANGNHSDSTNDTHEKVEPPTNAKNLQNPVNDQHESMNGGANNDHKTNGDMSNGQ